MNNSNFKAFKECIRTAGECEAVWWAGYLWLDLTKKQFCEVYNILANRRDGVCKVIISIRNGRTEIEIPSGIRLFIEK